MGREVRGVKVVGVVWVEESPVLVGVACRERGRSFDGRLSLKSGRVLYRLDSCLEQSYLHGTT